MLRYNTGTNVRDRHGKLPIEYAVNQPDLCNMLSSGLDQKKFKLSEFYQFLSIFGSTVSLYSDEGMSSDTLIVKLNPDTLFIPLETAEKAMKIAAFAKAGSVLVGYVEAGYVG